MDNQPTQDRQSDQDARGELSSDISDTTAHLFSARRQPHISAEDIRSRSYDGGGGGLHEGEHALTSASRTSIWRKAPLRPRATSELPVAVGAVRHRYDLLHGGVANALGR